MTDVSVGNSEKRRKIFISYRRSDSGDIAGRIYDRLVERYGARQVFKDVDSIPPGVNFPEYISESIEQSAVELVIIGPHWLDASKGWRRRLEDPSDFVRIEVETALRLGVVVIPVLVGGASLLSVQRLPTSLRPLLQQNGLTVRQDPDFTHDMQRVCAAIDYWQSQPRAVNAPQAGITSASDSVPIAPSHMRKQGVEDTLLRHPAVTVSPPVPSALPLTTRRIEEPDLNIVRSPQKRTTRLASHIYFPLTIISALAVVIVAIIGLYANGLAFSKSPNVSATQTAYAWAQGFKPTRIGPCNRVSTGSPVLTSTPEGSTSSGYFSWQPQNGVTCASDGKSAEILSNGYLYLDSTSVGFPSAFQVSVTIAFGTDSSSDCAYINIVSQSESVDTVNVCANGTGYVSGTQGLRTTSQNLGIHATYLVTISVRGQQITFGVNGTTLGSSASYIGHTSFLEITGSDQPIQVVALQLVPLA